MFLLFLLSLLGRLQYAQLRTAIDEFNAALTAKYAFLQLGFSNIKSLQDKKKYKVGWIN